MLLDGEEPENQRDTCQRREKNPGIAAERMIALPASMRENRHSRLRSSAVRTLNHAPVVGCHDGGIHSCLSTITVSAPMTRGWSRFRRYKPKLTKRVGDSMWHGLEAVYVLPRMVPGCRATHQSHNGEIPADSTRNCPVSSCRATRQSHNGGVERSSANYE